MPVIRNYTQSYTSTGATTTQGFMPATQPGDLILALNNAKTIQYPVNFSNTIATFTGSISGNVLTVWVWSTPTYANISPGTTITGSGIAANTVITGQTDVFTAGPNLISAITSLSSGGTINGNTFVVTSATGISRGQLVSGTGIPGTTYVTNVSATTITISQPFTSNGSGVYFFNTAGYLGRYTINSSQTVANTTVTASWSTLFTANNLNIASQVAYKIATANEPDPVYALTWQNNAAAITTTAQTHLISVRDVNPAQPFNGNAFITSLAGGGGDRQIQGAVVESGNATVVGSIIYTHGLMRTAGGVASSANVELYANVGTWAVGQQITTFPTTSTYTITGQNTTFSAPIVTLTLASGGTVGTNGFVATTTPAPASVGNLIMGSGIPTNTYITSIQGSNVFISNTFTTNGSGSYGVYTAGGSGHYQLSANSTSSANILVAARSTTLSVSQVLNGTLSANMVLLGTGITAPTIITSLSSGTGGIGTYTVNVSANVSATTIYGNLNYRDTMPTLRTEVNNSLLIYLQASGTAAPTVPMILEGPCVYEDGADAAAQSQGWSWGFQRTAGTTPTNVYWNRLDTTSSILATIAITPASATAAAVPAYCAADSSYWFDPINGTTVYNFNNAITADATVWFGSAIQGYTLSNTAATAANVDVGINSYHSMASLFPTTVATNTWYGATLTIAAQNRINVTGKNILVHWRPATPKTIQTTDDISHGTTRGVAFGISSGGTTPAAVAAKVWHVHGAGTLWNNSTYVPVVINDSSSAGLLQTTGSYSGTTAARFGFFMSGFQVPPIWNVGSLWSLDTTVIAGGTSGAPVTIQGLVKSSAYGKERISVLQQGALEALVLQPLQFGDGGTNPIYLNLDSSVIEFPKQYDIDSKQVFYAGADNVAGITYYAGTGDTIIHTNAVVASQSKYRWGFHPSSASSSLASYDFSGTRVIGAGTITLNTNINLNGLQFIQCGEITAPYPATLANVTFRNTVATSGQGALVISGSTQTDLQNKLNALASCTFNDCTASSAALRIQWTGAALASGITLSTSTLQFNNNTYDIYWDSPGTGVAMPLYFQLTGSAYAAKAVYDGSDRVYLQLTRNLTINNIINGSKIRIYRATGNVLLANADVIGTTSLGLSNITQSTDTVYAGRFTATYTYPYTVAVCSTSGVANSQITVSSLSSSTIFLGQVLSGTGIPQAQNISIGTISGNGSVVTAFYSSTQSTVPFVEGQLLTISNVSVSAYNTTGASVIFANLNCVQYPGIVSTPGATGGNIVSVGTFIVSQISAASGTGGIQGLEGVYQLNQPVKVTAGTVVNFDTPVYVVVYALGYQALRPTTTLVLGGQSLTVEQQIDRQYTNPA